MCEPSTASGCASAIWRYSSTVISPTSLSFRAKRSAVEESLTIAWFRNNKRCLDFARHDKQMPSLEFSAPRRAGEWNDVANVRHASHKHEHALKTKAKPGMRNRTVTAQVEIPFVIGRIHIVAAHVFF